MSIGLSKPISIYIHVPFCIRKCPYCDFNSYPVDDITVTENDYTKSLLSELRYYAKQQEWSNRICSTVYFGGGTPSLFSPESFSLLLDSIRASFTVTENCEVTIEANPFTLSAQNDNAKLSQLRKLGINRISLGAQSFNPQKLAFLGRLHNPQDTVNSFNSARQAGFDNISLDLIFGTRDESLEQWKLDLEAAIALNPEHISAYSLTIEPNSAFFEFVRNGKTVCANDETVAQMYVSTMSLLDSAGYSQYEISNYAKPQRACIHNIAYWTYHDYLGLGAGAHSYLGPLDKSNFGCRWANIRLIDSYVEQILSTGHAQDIKESLNKEQDRIEYLFLSLRQVAGISKSDYVAHLGHDFNSRYENLAKQLSEEELAVNDQNSFRLTKRGFLMTDYIVGQLVDC